MRIRSLHFAVPLIAVISLSAQNAVKERSFAFPVSTLQATLKKLPGGTSGSLPVLEGFIVPGAHSFDRYQHPYYQCSVRITSTSSGGARVRVAAKITAWNSDPAHSGYEAFESNGRVESDLLDRLQDALQLQSANQAPTPGVPKGGPAPSRAKAEPPPEISAPVRQLPALHDIVPRSSSSVAATDPALEQEAKNLEQILLNQSHPTNLVAVKQEETPVLQSPRTDATVLFLANAEDEFEILSANSYWVYVRISGLSRGWLRRSRVEMLDGSPDQAGSGTAVSVKGQETTGTVAARNSGLFSVGSEEVGSFPGQWEPLKGKSVRIISIQPASGAGRVTSPVDKLQFAESEFKQQTQASSTAAGVVLIFDSEDGGMVATTKAALEQWKTGAISDQAFLKQCYIDPPEIFGSGN